MALVLRVELDVRVGRTVATTFVTLDFCHSANKDTKMLTNPICWTQWLQTLPVPSKMDRSTVHRWLKDEDFVAEVRDALHAYLTRPTRKASQRIEQNIGAPRTALEILKGVGVLWLSQTRRRQVRRHRRIRGTDE